jgi:archaemetzincin
MGAHLSAHPVAISRRAWLRLLACASLASCTAPPSDDITAAMAKIRPLFKRKTPPQPGDWLAEHKEPGQTYQQFRKLVEQRAVWKYSLLRLVPIGPLSAGQSAVLQATEDLLRPFFGLELVVDPPANLDDLPEEAHRFLAGQETPQLLTSHLLNKVLLARRGEHDAAVLGITAFDLWPGEGWHFVFGQASLIERVGVWSMARNGDPDAGPTTRNLCAIRTAMTATHETGHMFGVRHCIAYQCGMNGSNHLEERDRQPLEFCPECQAKLWWTCRLDPLARSRALEAVARKHGFSRAAADFARQSEALS